MNEAPPLHGLVLAGGQSRRMGSDKALLRRGGETQLDFAVRLLKDVVAKTWVSARAGQADAERSRYPLIIDRYENLGPVAGILSAMDQEPQAAWLVLACDLPNVTPETLQALVAGRDPRQPFTAFASSHNGLPEPLCAIFEPSARLLLDADVTDGIVCPRKMMIRANLRLLEQPDPAALDNINTPQDLARTTLEVAGQ